MNISVRVDKEVGRTHNTSFLGKYIISVRVKTLLVSVKTYIRHSLSYI